MDLVNIIYKYVNRFINSKELINLLENIDKTKFSSDEVKKIDMLLKDVKKVVDTIPNEIDEIEKNRISNLNHIIELFEKNIDNDSLSEENKKLVEKHYNSLLKDKEHIKDCGPRYEKMVELLNNNSVYIKYAKSMNDLELLEFITQYISVPLYIPLINQEAFDDLVTAGIKEDKRESLWRLAMNYNRKGKDFTKIVDYLIEKRDHYYLAELISGVEEDLDLDKIITKALKTNDLEFIKKVATTPYLDPIFTDEQKNKVKEFIEKKEMKKNEKI